MADEPSIYVALAKVMGDVRGVAKGDRNTAQNFSFRGIDAVLNAVGPALRKYGVLSVPHVIDHTTEIVEVGQKKTPMKSVVVTVTYTFYGPAGDSVAATVLGEAMDSGDKAVSKAMSVALRTALIQTLALPTDEKDPDQDTYERAPMERPAQPHNNGQQRKPDPRRDAWQRASAAAVALGMSKEEFEKDFTAEAGVAVKDGTAEQFTTYAQQLEAARESAPASS
jgi:hypothetical protein